MLKELQKISLSNEEMMKLVNNRANLVQYPELSKYNNIDQLLQPYGACIILYLTRKNYGHWTCVFKVDNNTIEHFDPYGLYIDEELNFNMDPYFRKVSGQDFPHLSFLLYNSPYNLSFNQYKFQQKIKDVSTCGRHTGMRLILRNLNLNDYKKLICSTKYTPDEVVTIITHAILNE